MKLQDLLPILDRIAPLRFAETWDNVGLLTGDASRDVRRAMLTIDYTSDVAKEVREHHCDLVLSYHPPIFEAIKQLTAPSVVFDAIAHGIAIYSPHTALDCADGGTNDVLAEILGIEQASPLRPVVPSPWHYKLVVFVPRDAVEKVAGAIFEAGAGWIGNYSQCSFRADGTGTFLGHEGTNPAIGKPGQLERTPETRIETIVHSSKLSAVVSALKTSHPYEEPAFDLIQLAALPDTRGIGRLGAIKPIARTELIERVRDALGVKSLLVAGPTSGQAKSAACCAGAGGSLAGEALRQKADVYLTGEMRHHDALKAADAGMTVICALHSNTERVTLPRYARQISDQTGIECLLSKADRDPFTIV